MLPREIDLNEWLASNSEYFHHTALEIAAHAQVGIHSPVCFVLFFYCFQHLEKHAMTIYAYCIMCVIIP